MTQLLIVTLSDYSENAYLINNHFIYSIHLSSDNDEIKNFYKNVRITDTEIISKIIS